MKQYDEIRKYMKVFEEPEEDFETELEKDDKPLFLMKYLKLLGSKRYEGTLQRLRFISYFCGCDYTKIYNNRMFYSRFYHSLNVANMTWHFTHNKIDTLSALFHDVGTPCFAHVIDFLMGDSLNQETSEMDVLDVLKNDREILDYLKMDDVDLDDLRIGLKNSILENDSPKLCTDRLDGVLGGCYIWLRTHDLNQVKEVYDDLCILRNEYGQREIGFRTIKIAEKFSKMVVCYARELQTNRDKFVLQYIADVIKECIKKGLFNANDLYRLKEKDLIEIFRSNIDSWKDFEIARNVISSNKKPDGYSISVEAKKRSVIPLVRTADGDKRLNELTIKANKRYDKINAFEDKKYGYVKRIKNI